MTPLEEFDAALGRVTQERSQHYGHPKDNFRRSDALKQIIQECHDPLIRNTLSMICEKIARLIQSPHHTDSWIDIAGYARCGVMTYGDTEFQSLDGICIFGDTCRYPGCLKDGHCIHD